MHKNAHLIWLSLVSLPAFCQFDQKADSVGKIHYYSELAGTFSTNDQLPFWFRTNKYGSLPPAGSSAGFIAGVVRNYATSQKKKLADWGTGVEGRFNLGNRNQFILTEAFIKGRLSIFQLKAGRSKDIIGLVDSTLSSGAFSISGNALGIPKIELSIPEYWNIPFTNNIIAIKGSLAHGWLGKVTLRNSVYNKVDAVSSYYHALSVYGRIGKPSWKLKLYGGFNHLVMWGNEREIYGEDNWGINNLKTYYYIALGQPYLAGPTGTSKVGNHLGSIDQAIEYQFKKSSLSFYHQFFYDVGGLYHGNNLKDGLFGLSYKMTKDNRALGLHKIVVEYFASKSQGGESDATVSPSGDEDYYNNYLYYQAWSYNNENLGNNFLTNRKYAKSDLPNRPKEYVVNSRIILWHVGIQGWLRSIAITGKFSFSRNYGTYGSSPWGNSTGPERIPGPPPYFSRVNQFSGYVETSKEIKNGFHIAIAFAADQGDLLYNTEGIQVRLFKVW